MRQKGIWKYLFEGGGKEDVLTALACELAKEAFGYFQAHFPMDSAHTVFCFVRLYDYLKESDTASLIDLAAFKDLLQRQLQQVITYDTDKWATEYVCKPSLFISSKASDFYEESREICEYECAFIENSQKPDGTWAITWSWAGYPEEWSISKNWWACVFAYGIAYYAEKTAIAKDGKKRERMDE